MAEGTTAATMSMGNKAEDNLKQGREESAHAVDMELVGMEDDIVLRFVDVTMDVAFD